MSTFSLYCRDGIWYAHVNIREGVRKRISLKTKSKKQAMAKALEMQAEGAWEPSGDGSWWSYAKDWWIWDKCPYVRESLRNGRRLTKGYVAMCRAEMMRYIDPVFHDMPLSKITSGDIDEWKYSLHEKHGLSGKSANNYLTIMKVMFDYWWRHGIIKENPCLKVRQMSGRSRERGILTQDEVRKLFSTKGAWDNPVAMLANMLAACTGMRMGEVQALRRRDISADGMLHVEHSYSEDYGLKDTKTHRSRKIPIPKPFAWHLLSLCGDNPDGYVFSLGESGKPLYRSCILDSLRRALVRIGVSLEDQKARGICFHSWRHFLNTRLRASGLPDAVTQQVTGHSTQEMTEHYSHIDGHDLDRILAVTSSLIV